MPSDISKIPEKVEEVVEVAAEVAKKPLSAAAQFFKMEAAGGILLVIAAAAALIIANSPFYEFYDYILNQVKFGIGFNDAGGTDFSIKKPLLLWINDGLMAIFFFLVGLEIKREIISGELSSRDKIILPAIAAIGGILAPALIYYFFNAENPEALRGWAIPAATDIAFALGILSLVGSRVPVSLKAFLLAVAVIDDIAAILIIAIFFSGEISFGALYFAGACIAVLAFMNWRHVSSIAPYIFVTIILWIAVLESGIHATIAGVIAALFIPITHREYKKDKSKSPLKGLEHDLHYLVAFAILPIFGFANAGVPFAGMGLDALLNPVTLGIALGLFVGKQVGVFGFMSLAVLLKISPKPKGANWVQLYAVSLLCGVGFTMSLFIGGLAFDGIEMQASVRLGVLMGSIISAVMAYSLLRYGPTNKQI
ncbi:MAG: Na+/H+ antiporter NhaA [Alphaproteobacteria bacterium]|nr:Na+/H+ antiporter NhaA [Alphaproteobacteria bacterium]NCQ87514.1 Na+/H+ antiporter NhaA [Alphaproteobacteria bacterium]NCT06383.1 Na+/H+ antiporter NhaA [Alphaproteobacteria bacterium]